MRGTPAFTVHAVSRYIERVKPSLNPERARAECKALAALGFVSVNAPRWLVFDGDCDGWLHCGDVAFPLKNGYAVTCLVRGLMPASIRAHRNRDRSQRTYAATHKHRPQGRPSVGEAA
jgi:hypothetical protein